MSEVPLHHATPLGFDWAVASSRLDRSSCLRATEISTQMDHASKSSAPVYIWLRKTQSFESHRKRVSLQKLSGNEVHRTNALLSLIKIMLCIKLLKEIFKSKLFSFEIFHGSECNLNVRVGQMHACVHESRPGGNSGANGWMISHTNATSKR